MRISRPRSIYVISTQYQKGGTLSAGGTTFSPNFWSAWEDFKSSCHGYLPAGRLTMLFVKKDF